MILALVFGLIFGSFLNVVIYRLKTGEPLGFSRSFCPECRAKLKWFDLIPLFSFIFLRGRCRYCQKKISWQYPIVEILSGLIWVGAFYVTPPDKGGLGGVLNFVYYLFIFSALLVIAVYDFKWKIIPDKIIYPAIAVALIYNLFNLPLDKGGLGGGLLTAATAFLFFFLFFYFSKGKAMGLGDAKLAFLIGLFLGPWLSLAAFTSAFVIGAVFGIMLIASRRRTLKSIIAFGPFLVAGAAVAFFFSDFVNSLFIF